jgi:hypothetical protein
MKSSISDPIYYLIVLSGKFNYRLEKIKLSNQLLAAAELGSFHTFAYKKRPGLVLSSVQSKRKKYFPSFKREILHFRWRKNVIHLYHGKCFFVHKFAKNTVCDVLSVCVCVWGGGAQFQVSLKAKMGVNGWVFIFHQFSTQYFHFHFDFRMPIQSTRVGH